jgi:hypothetical protein
MRKLLKIVLLLLVAYSVFVIGFFVAMRQPPQVFCGIMSKTPGIIFSIVPFKRMWLQAREGRLRAGDQAPDFSLETHDSKSKINLSDLQGKSPVVLVFGSYT